MPLPMEPPKGEYLERNDKIKRIGILGLQHDSNTLRPEQTTLRHFQAGFFCAGRKFGRILWTPTMKRADFLKFLMPLAS